MKYLKIVDDQVVYPFKLKDQNNVAFSINPKLATLKKFNIFQVKEIFPTIGEYEVMVTSSTPELVDGVWSLIHTAEYLAVQDAINMALATIKANRRLDASADINGVQVTNKEDRENIEGAIEYYDRLTTEAPLVWIMSDNSAVIVTKEQLQTVKDIYVLRKSQIFMDYQVKRTAILAATTVEELITVMEG